MNKQVLIIGGALLASLLLLLVFVGAVALVINQDDDPTLTEVTSDYRGSLFPEPIQLTDFSIPATTGDNFTLSDQRGKVVLIYFGYMTCPDFCPATMGDLTRVFRTFDEATAEQVEAVMFTIDPERDELERLTRYIAAFNEDFIGVRPESLEQMSPIIGEFGVVAVKEEVDSALGYLMQHTTSLFMIDPQGRLVERFTFDTPADDIAHDVELLLAESQESAE